MKIAQVAPLYESVPPALYGGTERIVSYLTEELVALGHEVTLFASGDSTTRARLIGQCPRGLRLDPTSRDPLAYHVRMVEQVFQSATEFDVIHFHTDHLQYSLARRCETKHLTTLHGRLDLPEVSVIFREFHEMPVVSVSEDQQQPVRWLNWLGAVHHGIPEQLYQFGSGGGGYLAFLGRISPEKRVDWAIEAAIKAGIPLKIAAKIDKADVEYYEGEIRPLLDHDLIEYVGEIGDRDKDDFLGNAMALLFPIDWPEPFGMVMIEALACGTPVVAMSCGSTPEVIDDGVSGALIERQAGVEGLIEGIERACRLDRRLVRDVFERRFTAQRMALEYQSLYERLCDSYSPLQSMRKAVAFD
jgi:glycosyltransferase involved in cell wall biosynthesis